jgi:hypothetical protein
MAVECDGLNASQVNASIRELSKKYDVYDIADKQPLSKETVEAIMTEIKSYRILSLMGGFQFA